MLVNGLGLLARKHPRLGIKLMQVMGRTAFRKALENGRHSRAAKMPTSIEWKNYSQAAEQGAQEAEEALVRMFVKHGMSERYAQEICDMAQYHFFKEQETLVQPMTICTQLLIIVEGSVLLEHLDTEIVGEGVLHAAEYFGSGVPITSLTRVVATSLSGLVAGIGMAQLNALLAKDGNMAHEVLLVLGKLGLQLHRLLQNAEDRAANKPGANRKGRRRSLGSGERIDCKAQPDSFTKRRATAVSSCPGSSGKVVLTMHNLKKLDHDHDVGSDDDEVQHDRRSVDGRSIGSRQSSKAGSPRKGRRATVKDIPELKQKWRSEEED
eukprot:3673000-Prymnesium_polylepis.1